MTPPLIGFDPAAVLARDAIDGGAEERVEVTLWQRDDGTWRISIEHADESTDEVTCRATFLDEVVVQERSREAAA